MGGPFNQVTTASPENLRRVYVCGHAAGKHTPGCVRIIVTAFAGRAFRRPATRQEVDQFTGLVALARKQGDSFEEGIATALQAILVSPSFLYRIERDQPASVGNSSVPVSQYELASRLSYLLWSSTPDAELLRTAAHGSLRQPAVLEAEVARMLRDPKSFALVENFAGQWLQFKNIDVVRPDLERFPGFDDGLRLAMRRETELFLDNIFRNDGSVIDLLDADYTFLNERLARFYGIAGVTGPEFRRVNVGGTLRGGGILAQGSVLTVSSYSTRTSPVLRGKWILENLLNAPPPPPPASVPALDDTKVGESASLRQQMEVHRKKSGLLLVPLAHGSARVWARELQRDRRWRDEDGKFPVDASGELPGGRAFRGPEELKVLLKADREAFVRGLTEKLLTYALGRGLERYDRQVVAAIAAKQPSSHYRFSQLVIDIVNSLPFQMRHASDGKQNIAKIGDISR